MESIAVLESRQGKRVSIDYFSKGIEPLASRAKIDTYIVSTYSKFSSLASNLRFLSADIGVSVDEIKYLADWNLLENARVSFVAIPTRRDNSCLRGIILASSETSKCYKRFAALEYGRPYRDFYYNVTYEAIAYASQVWNAHRLAISHLSSNPRFHKEISTCNVEALAHFCDSSVNAIESFTFLSNIGFSMEQFTGISRLNIEGETGQHRPIFTETVHHEGHVLVHLNWDNDTVTANGKRI